MSITIKKEERWEREHFDSLARDYEGRYRYDDKFTKYKIKKKVNEFIKSIDGIFEKRKGIKILEIGCGTGVYTSKYATRLPQAKILAIDISGEMVKIAEEKRKAGSNITYKIGSAYGTNLRDSSTDIVCGYYVLHHLNFELARKEIRRVLRPGGLVFFYEPNILNPIVFLIKSNKLLKKLIGDSPGEWAINPFKVLQQWPGFELVSVETSEYIIPTKYLSFKAKMILDRFTSSVFSKIPGINIIGGSVKIVLKKRK